METTRDQLIRSQISSYRWGTNSALFAFDFPGAHARAQPCKERNNMLGTILLVILIIVILGALPTWPYSSGWGYYPSGGFGLLFLIVIVLLLMGKI